jgi:hypothetical protein
MGTVGGFGLLVLVAARAATNQKLKTNNQKPLNNVTMQPVET